VSDRSIVGRHSSQEARMSLIHCIPKTGSLYGYQLRPQSRLLLYFAKLYTRLVRQNWPALLPEDDHLPRALRATLDQLDVEIASIHEEAALAA
jgi:hypothetical protein